VGQGAAGQLDHAAFSAPVAGRPGLPARGDKKLTDAEVTQIAQLKTDKRRAAQAYVINGTRGRGTVSLRPGPRAYSICTSDPIADVPEREAALRATDGDPWAALDLLAGRDELLRCMELDALLP
jgi:hypothetical protein